MQTATATAAAFSLSPSNNTHRSIMFPSVDLQGPSAEHLSSRKEFDAHRGLIG
jgi:hypothetical protein